MDQRLKILVVEDEQGIQEVLAVFLQQHEVMVSPDGVHGIQMIEKHEFDLVITDVRMPGASGHVLLETIAATKPQLPVIVISGDQEIETASDSLDLGAVSFLYKPFDKEELLAEIEEIFSKDKS